MPSAALRYCTGSPTCREKVSTGRCAVHAREREQARPNLDVRKLYRTARWKALRSMKFSENPLCVECQAEGVIREWTDLDHVIPHRGDPALFWNPFNLQGLCASHHSAKTGRGQ